MRKMPTLVETDIGILPAYLVQNPAVVRALVIDEIERALPRIISSLDIAPELDEHSKHLLQYRLRVGKGFRPFTPAQRKKTVEQLQHESFVRSLRRVQDLAINKLQASGNILSSSEVFSESGNTRVPAIKEIGDMAETRILSDIKTHEPEANDVAATPEISPLDGNTSGAFVEALLPNTLVEVEEAAEDILKLSDVSIELQEPVAQRDVRGLLALLKGDKLITFVEPDTGSIVARMFEKIEVPDKEVYRSLNVEDLMTEYHALIRSHSPDEVATELRLLDALLVSLENEAQWSRINKRRFHLITKKHSIGLTETEVTELEELQSIAERQADLVQGLPFAELAMLKDYARRLGFNDTESAPAQ
jgi:hypothetical protein